ncbi:MAG: tyrosine-type recombinase/integrase, partial [Myxococcales bacterium]|nr:tyrosine-type recombinase/integrase [Myxococcales bacterium]
MLANTHMATISRRMESYPLRKKSSPTKYPGVHKIADGEFRVRGKVKDSSTGKPRELDRIIKGVTAKQANTNREAPLQAMRVEQRSPTRKRVGEFAQSWMKSKTLKLGEGTAEKYATALDNHILPHFGDWYYDLVTTQDIQDWVDECLRGGWVTKKTKVYKPYEVTTVKTWFRVLRTMTKTAIDTLSLQRDPTLRIEFPEEREREESKSLSEEELARFLGEMERRFPQHFALAMVLAYTGLRFCHVSGLEWDDWDEANGTLKIRRSQVRGKVGPVSRKKRAPAEYPIGPELSDILRWHRRRMIKGQAPGLELGRMFPSKVGSLRASSSVHKAWVACAKAAGIQKNFTPHGLRYTFNDLLHRVKKDPLLRRAPFLVTSLNGCSNTIQPSAWT